MSAIETAAVLLGLVNVVLIIRRSIWNYPFGLAMVVLYAKIFFDIQLYSDAMLQVFFFVVQLYGWHNWRQGRDDSGRVKVSWLTLGQRTATGVATLTLWLVLGLAMVCWTDASYPLWDAAIAAISVAAQFLLSFRRIDAWPLWIAVDCLAIALFIVKDLHLTAALYAVFLVLAILGLRQWRRAVQTVMT